MDLSESQLWTAFGYGFPRRPCAQGHTPTAGPPRFRADLSLRAAPNHPVCPSDSRSVISSPVSGFTPSGGL